MPLTIIDSTPLGALAQVGDTVTPGVVRVFRSMGAHNDTGAPVVLTVHLVPNGGAADNSNRLINRTVPDSTTDLCPELLGRGLKEGGKLIAGGAGLNFGGTAIDTIIG